MSLPFRSGLLAVVVAAVGCGSDAVPVRPTIVLVSIDTVRSDRLPAYGYADGSTPAIDALARDGILFERAFAEAPLTLPSHASLFSGEIPPRHGVRDNLGFTFDPARSRSLAARLDAAGYQTFGAVSASVLARRTGIADGFSGWDEPPVGGRAERPGRAALDAAKGWLAAADPAKPRFLFLHLYEPHAPYRPPEPFRSRLADPYDGEIAAADALVGELVAELERRDLYGSALVVLLSDHGEGLGDHGEAEHGLLLHREALQVPLVVKLPGRERAGERVRRNVGLVDLVPTVSAVLGLPPEDSLSGISLLAREAPPERPLYAETFYPFVHFGWSDLASVVAGDAHLISGRRDELFDLARDPAERFDRLARERRAAAAMRRFLDGIDRTLAPPAPPRAGDEEAARALASLGYLSVADRASASALPDPRDRVREIAPVLAGLRSFHDGDFATAVAALAPAVEDPEAPPIARRTLADAYEALGKRDKAAAIRGAAGRADAFSSADLAAQAALRLLELGRAQAALDLLADELPRHPRSAPLKVIESRALLASGRITEAARAADAAVGLDDRFADAWYQRAVTAMSDPDGDPVRAASDLARAVALDARHVPARKALAMVRHASGDDAEARRLLGEVLEIDPGDRDAREDLALLSRAAGR